MDIGSRAQAIDGVLSGLQFLILAAAKTAASEQEHPSADADKSDDEIRRCQKEVAQLRGIRSEFEQLVTGVIL